MAPALIAFAAVLLVVLGVYWLLILRPEQSKDADLKRRLKRDRVARRSVQPKGVVRERQPFSRVAVFDRLLERRADLATPLQRLIEQSAVKTNVGVILLSCGLLFLTGVVLGQFYFNSLLAGIAVGCLLCPSPVLFLVVMRQRRIAKFEELFPEAMDLLGRAMRAGHTFPTGLGMVANDMPEPIAGEFRLLFDRQNFGAPLEDALREFADRVPLLDAKFFVTAVLTQREAGGNLAEVLDNLASVVRRRFKVKREVRSKSAHGRLTGWVLVAMPPALALAFMVISPGYMRPLIDDPLGVRMVIGAAVLQVIGTLLVRKIVRIEY
jgi:tight adherence protein B